MSTERLVIQGRERLEAVLRKGDREGGVIVCHPHPQYGGSMYNGVVSAMEEGFFQAGFTTLKFDFRGVGGSTGSYSDGVGETEDVVDAWTFLRGRIGPQGRIMLAGYSFGAWVAGMAASRIEERVDLFFTAYPFSVYAPADLKAYQGTIYLVGGSHDDVCPLDDLLSFYKSLQCEKYLKILPSAHFFEGREGEIRDFILETFEDFILGTFEKAEE